MAPSSLVSFEQYAQAARRRIEKALAEAVEFDDGCPEHLREAIRYSLLGPGKRLRPLLTLMSAAACGGSEEAAMPAACAVEMVHAYSLVHDDLPAMDDDDLRRGRPSCHKAFGEAVAILAGDALLTHAFATLANGVRPKELAATCCAELAKSAGATMLVGGQADDLAAEQTGGDLETLLRIHRRKTGAMFVCALRLGALTAGAEPSAIAALEQYGHAIGLAFQITDDLLDVDGDEESVGKRVGKDVGRGKLTFPGLLGASESRQRVQQLVDEACAAVAEFGPRAAELDALARYIGGRNR